MSIIKNLKIILLACAVTLCTVAAVVLSFEASALPDRIFVSGTRKPHIASKPYIEIVPGVRPAGAMLAADNSYEATATLLGIIPLRQMTVTRVSSRYVELYGTPVGIRLYSDGIVVSGLGSIHTADGNVNPGELCGLRSGDIIKAVEGKRLSSAYDMLDSVENSHGSPLRLTVTRAGGEPFELTLRPAYSETDGCWRAGIWVRETSSGLGTLTFVAPDIGIFGGLGHAICDAQTGEAIDIYGGDLMTAELTGVIPGIKGAPGELVGTLGGERLGSVTINSDSGVFGQFLAGSHGSLLARVAMKQELKEGSAQIMTTLPGDKEPQLYDCLIERISYDPDTPSRNLIVKITDERLIERCGGIVQGMSGSPILQDGVFAAALTHVFVGDPTMGYAIFAENMMAFAEKSPSVSNDVA